MKERENKLNLLDFVDINFLQELQDLFANTMNFASLTYDLDVPITKPTNFTDFCQKYTRGCEVGAKRCKECDLKLGKLAAEKGEPVIYSCHAGLIDFVVPIMVKGQHLASIYGGQVLTEQPDEDKFREIARQIGVNEDEYIEALREIKVVPLENIKQAMALLSLIANAVSEVGIKNLELGKKNEEEKLYNQIIRTIRSSLDIDETKQIIVNIIGETLKADRCIIAEYDKTKDTAFVVGEYLSSSDIVPYIGFDINDVAPGFVESVKQGKTIIVNNKEISTNEDVKKFQMEKERINKYKDFSFFAFPLYYAGDLIGGLAISYIKKRHEIEEDELNLLSMIADEIATAIYHSKMFKITKKQAQREAILRKVIEAVRISLDINEVKKKVVYEVGKAFKADRCYFRSYFGNQNEFLAPDVEYLSSDDIPSLLNVEPNQESLKYFSDEMKKQKKGFYPIVVDDEFAKGTPLGAYMKSAGIKADYAVPIVNREDKLFWLVLHYAKENPKLGEDDLKLLETIAYQIDIAFEQINLYNTVKKIAERETILRKIVEAVRSTLEMSKIKKTIVNEIGLFLKAYRCIIVTLNVDTDEFSVVDEDSVYLCSPDIKTMVGFKPKNDYFNYAYKEHKKIITLDTEDFVRKNKLQNTDAESFFLEYNVKSLISTPVVHLDKLYGALIVQYDKKMNDFENENIEFIKAIAKQVGVAFHQDLLFKREKRTTEREFLLRKITETIRGSLDIDETLAFICEETAKLFKVQRSAIAVFPNPENLEDCKIKKEYKTSPSVRGVDDLKGFGQMASYWANNLLEAQGIWAVENIAESDAPDYFKDNYNFVGVKSVIGISIGKDKDVWGILILSEYDEYRHWSEDEISLLKTISNQIYIAINQAELYDKLRQTTENLNAILDNIPYWAWMKDKDGKYVLVNKEYAKDKNLTIEQFIGKTDFDFFPKEMAELYRKNDREVMESKKLKTNKEEATVINGENRVLESFKQPFFNNKGEVVGTIGIAKDITERKEFELELLNRQQQILKASKRENLLRRIMASSVNKLDIKEVINSIVADVGSFFQADRCLYFEYDPDCNSIEPMNYTEYLSSNDIKSFTISLPGRIETEAIINLLKKREVFYVENLDSTTLVIKNKHMLADDLSVKAFLIAPIYYGEIDFGAIVLHYVQDFKQFAKEEINLAESVAHQSALVIHQTKLYSTIEKNEKYTRAVFDSIKDGIITINDDFVVESCNPALETLWGYSMQDIIGKKLSKLLIYECGDNENKTCLLKEGTVGIKKNGEKFPIEIDVEDINFEDKNVTLLVIRDITERTKIEKMKNEFISTVSHELRTPLTSIKGSLGLVKSGVLGALPNKAVDMLNIADNNCTRLSNLINDILDLEKIKAGKYEFFMEELEIGEILEQSVILNQPYADQYGVKIKLINLEEKAFINADRNKILQIISNLFSNSVKFSHRGEEVVIAAELDDGNVRVSFRDVGIGIPEEAKYKIFQSFSQVDSSDTRAKGGTGLGLSICKLIVENMGGEIDFLSNTDKGSTFFFTFPRINK